MDQKISSDVGWQQNKVIAEFTAHAFFNRALEGRRIISEVWGTFLLVLVGAGGSVVNTYEGGHTSHALLAVAPGMVVMSIIYFMGTISGAHLNPAVTFAFALRRNFPWSRVPGYVLGQTAGAIVAILFLRYMFGPGDLGATVPGPGISPLKAMFMEIVITTGLVNTILGTASGARNIGTNGAIAVGSYIALTGIWSGPISGASMNPIRSLAPDIVRGDFHTTWVYILGPIIGAALGVGFEWLLKGKPTPFGALAAQGSGE
jgi:aquaporin Z